MILKYAGVPEKNHKGLYESVARGSVNENRYKDRNRNWGDQL